ncbi:murein hydrolase activator EnvC family protein [Microbacterium hydrocarbonoxydans]|uniref:murein hydrolase activator EnvC family protein n=1 Tax=Microbacterium hydrocarbonoxydans TaxID=273678 RepID=UPI003D96CDDA
MRALSRIGALVALALLLPLGGLSSAATAAAQAAHEAMDDGETPAWLWPVDGPHTVVAAFRAPAHEYGAGHRGIDIAAPIGAAVRAPADGVVAFRGTVVDRPLITIEHEGGFVTTFEPLLSELSPGDAVSAGDVIGAVDVGGHAAAGTLHIGVRLHGVYVNPLLLFGEVPRAVLLPCCEPL